jgi:two-component system response regulator WspF
MKVAVVHSSTASLRAVETSIRKQGKHECLWTSMDGAGALPRCLAETPDVLLVDASLRNPDAAEVTRRVVEAGVCAVVLLAGGPDGDLSAVYEAMGAGALDVVACPTLDKAGATVGHDVLAAKLTKIARLLAPATANGKHGHTESRAAESHELVAIGASTGGPQAIYQVLSSLPRPVTSSIVIVQHIDGEFVGGLTDWLSRGTGVPVKVAEPGARPQRGTALLAGSGGHMILTGGGVFAYTTEPKDSVYRPSVDVLFNSLAVYWPKPAIAVLLTGMGRDGAQGLLRLRRAGWRTIVQDERTSVVFGMPKSAIKAGAAERVLPLDDVGPTLGRWLAGS